MEQTQRCENCQKDIPLVKAGTHYGYCKRNVIKCQLCGQMYDKNFQEEHEEEFHLTKECKNCQIKLYKKDEQRHSLICQMRPKTCQYCEMYVPSAQFNTHLKTCESRTTQCEICNKLIINKQYAFHRSTCQGKIADIGGQFRSQKKPDINKLGFEDSLSQLQREIKQEKHPEKAFKKDKIDPKREESRYPQRGSQGKAFQNKIPSKTQKKPEQIKQRQRCSQQVFRNFEEEFLYYPEENKFDFSGAFSSFYMNDLQQRLGRSSAHRNQSYLNDSIDNIEQISLQDQLLQQALFENRKKSRISLKNSSKQLPSDFLSQDIMNSSFYGKDILDIQKQKAIQREFERYKKPSKQPRKK